ncbi:MAG TPA: FKBP-type peptidyl-prolyl cis-trans isomerase [Terracidiphilus sp.]|nr:FKBP-type peptidyl-prolyl cis-trans isomerase [Terracidiphilus sp.]
MNRIVFVVCLSAATALTAQTAPKPATSTAKPSTTATHSTASSTAYKLPPGERRIPGIPKTAFTVRYQDIKIGTGAEGEAGKLWHVKYKGWRAADGVVFDSWENNRRPEMKDGKPVMGPDNKPVMGEPQPLEFPQGMGRLIPGFDYGLTGMRIGGKRRIFIPWQAAYGTRTIPDRPDHPGIPAKSDLIFDVELVDVTDMPQPPQRPMMMPHPGTPPPGARPATPPPSGQPATPPPSGAPATTPPPASTAPSGTPPSTAPANPGAQPQSKPQSR